MKRPKLCVVCENHADGITSTHGVDFTGIHELGVCPTCRRHAEIGRRVEGMPLAENGFGIGGVSYAAGRNEALREAKGEK